MNEGTAQYSAAIPRTSPSPSVRCAVSHTVDDGFITSPDFCAVCPSPYECPHSCVAMPRRSKRLPEQVLVDPHRWLVE
jgi:hypothetical protein